MARIDNVSFTDVMQIKGLGNLENAPLEEGLSLAQEPQFQMQAGG